MFKENSFEFIMIFPSQIQDQKLHSLKSSILLAISFIFYVRNWSLNIISYIIISKIYTDKKLNITTSL